MLTRKGNVAAYEPGGNYVARYFKTPFAADVHLVAPTLAGKQATSITLNGHKQSQNIHLTAAGDYWLSKDFE